MKELNQRQCGSKFWSLLLAAHISRYQYCSVHTLQKVICPDDALPLMNPVEDQISSLQSLKKSSPHRAVLLTVERGECCGLNT